jgi:hypothetical protein
MRGDLSTRYRVEAKTTVSRSFPEEDNGVKVYTMDALRLGPCPEDWSPGDQEINGMRLNRRPQSKL